MDLMHIGDGLIWFQQRFPFLLHLMFDFTIEITKTHLETFIFYYHWHFTTKANNQMNQYFGSYIKNLTRFNENTFNPIHSKKCKSEHPIKKEHR